jgi:hypothetical protein
MADVRRCKWCGRALSEYRADKRQQSCESCHGGPSIIEPEGGRWWRDCLSDEARQGLEAWLEGKS